MARKIQTKNGSFIELEVIKDLKEFRGFYLVLNDETIVKDNGYNTAALVGIKGIHYARGYILTRGTDFVEHLFNKLLHKETLLENELEDFYEMVSLEKPTCRGFDFRKVLHKVQNVQFWTLGEKPSKKEKKIAREYAPLKADMDLF